jgi:hypothetical protein
MTVATLPAALAAARLAEAILQHPTATRFAVMRTTGGPLKGPRIKAYPCTERALPAHELLGIYARDVTLEQLLGDLAYLDTREVQR